MALQPWHSWIPSIKRSLFFLSGFSFTDTDDSLGSKGRAGNHLSFQSTSTSTRSRTLKHLFATLHLRWLLRIFNRNACVYQTVLDGIYHIIELPFEWLIDDAMFFCLLGELILGFCYSDLAWETGGFELESTIILALQANRLT